MIRRCAYFLVATAVTLASCGGGSSSTDSRDAVSPVSASSAVAAMRAAPLSTQRQQPVASTDSAGSIDPLDAANQLMNYAETWYPQFFPEHAATRSALGYIYRAYSTGIYLGVKDGQVYVLGGVFGTEVQPVGAVTDFISPRPLVLSTLCISPSASHSVFATPSAAVGKNLGITLAGCSGDIISVRWQQTAGPAVALLSDKTQTLSVDPPAPGTYAFRADFTDAAGTARSQDLSVQVAPAPSASDATGLTLRASHSVRMGGKVSVRAWPSLAPGDEVKAVTWTQIEGPPVTLDLRTSRLATFTAPEVTRDTLIRLRATLHTTQGRSDSDEVMVLVERYTQVTPGDGNAVWAGDTVSRVYPYEPGGPYAGVLRRCTYDPTMRWEGPKTLCPLSTLPILAQETGGDVPSVEQVMARVLVSHDWLGRNFEAFLRAHDTQGDFRRMLNSVTAVVLSTHIRPSFYYVAGGAVYLDAESFWLTPEERDTINEVPDYRSEFGNGLQYQTLWRYVKDGQSIFRYFDERQRVSRQLDDVHREASWLLYHELAHALDFLPPSEYAGLQSELGVWDNVATRFNRYQITSDVVSRGYPLTSQLLLDLADVQFRGITASATQKALTPEQVAAAFSVDLATDDYAYSTPFEDTAMTLEEVLMQRRLGIRRDFAIADAGGETSATAIVRWGQRGRIGEPAIRPRAKAIVQALTPWLELAEVDNLPPPLAMRAGESWAANLQLPTIPRRARPKDAAPTLQEMAQFQHELRRMRHLHHGRGGPGQLRPAWPSSPPLR